MKVVILCGGLGIRAFPFTTYMPKPMLPLGGTPVIVHVIRNFVAQGFEDFVLAAGYRRSVLEDYFDGKSLGARISIVDTGDDADTGSRIYRCRHLLGDGPFVATYGDGLSDVPMAALTAFHRAHGGLATVTSVPMYSQYGIMTVGDAGRVESFQEKPLIPDHWVNAGFMILDPAVFADWAGDNLERDVLPALMRRGEVFSYRHRGFFKSFDSYKDVTDFDDEFGRGGRLPWQVVRAEAA